MHFFYHCFQFFCRTACAATLFLSACTSTATVNRPQSDAPNSTSQVAQSFYENKNVELIVTFAPGGGTDTWARTIAPLLQKHLGRNVQIQVVNRAGASGVAGTNDYFANHDPQKILVTSGSVFFPYLLGESIVEYDFNELVAILGSPVGGVVFVAPETGVHTAQDLCTAEHPLMYAGISPSGLDIIPLITFELLGLEVMSTFGYDGKGASRLAFEQGETNIEFQTTPGYLATVEPLVDTGTAIPLFTFGLLNNEGQVIRDPAFPELLTVPEVYELCFGSQPSGTAWDVYKGALAAGFTIQKVMWIHGSVPEETIAELRRAAEAAVADPEFSESAHNLIGSYNFFVGHEAQVTFAAASNLSPQSIAWLKTLLQDKYGVQF